MKQNSADGKSAGFIVWTGGLDKEEKSAIINYAVIEGLEKLMEVIETNRG